MQFTVAAKVVVTDEEIKRRNLTRFFDLTTPNLICYKLIAGLNIFYVSPDVFEVCKVNGWVKPRENIPELDFKFFMLVRGLAVLHPRLPKALELSTTQHLGKELEKIEQGPTLLTLTMMRANKTPSDETYLKTLKTLVEIKVNIKEQQILEQKSFTDLSYIQTETYEKFLDSLVSYLDREFMNSRNVFEMFKRSNFYDVDAGWVKQDYRFSFRFK